MDAVLVLIHSPLVGPLTWSFVATELNERRVKTLVPELFDRDDRRAPFWLQHVESVIQAINAISEDREIVLVGHSGAGPLLPAIRKSAKHHVLGYVFVDAGIPIDGMSRLDLMGEEDPEFAQQLKRHLAGGGVFPEWTVEEIEPIVANEDLRRQLILDLRPRSFDFFREPIPVFQGWPDAPCAYLQFSSSYDAPGKAALEAGWGYLKLSAGHFPMLDHPAEIASALLVLITGMHLSS
jgi:pimeloyl-ACP methyl ester carboxylesterase